MTAESKNRGKVRTSWEFEEYKDFTFPENGYGLPRRLKGVLTEDPKLPDVTVTVEIAVDEGRAFAHHVCVEKDRLGGIGWNLLANVKTRDIVGTAVLTALHRVVPQEAGTFSLAPLGTVADVDPEEVLRIVQRLVGYFPDLERFEGKRASEGERA